MRDLQDRLDKALASGARQEHVGEDALYFSPRAHRLAEWSERPSDEDPGRLAHAVYAVFVGAAGWILCQQGYALGWASDRTLERN